MRKFFSRAVAVAALAAPLLIAASAGAMYNGPEDPAAYREPQLMWCNGVPDFPTGYKAEVQSDMIGNLVDGYTYVELGGKVALYYFELIQESKDPNRLEARYTKISTLDWKREEGKGYCTVKKWKPLRKR